MPMRPPVHRPYGTKGRREAERERKRAFDRGRDDDPGRRWIKSRRWRKAREGQLNREPLCRACIEGSPPRVVAATEVDHITPHKGDARLFWDPENWQSLCKPCHSRKTATEDSRFAARG